MLCSSHAVGHLLARQQRSPCLLTILLVAAEYLEFLKRVTPDNQEEFMTQMRRFNLGPVGEADCPVFDGMFDYFQVTCSCLSALCTLKYDAATLSLMVSWPTIHINSFAVPFLTAKPAAKSASCPGRLIPIPCLRLRSTAAAQWAAQRS